MAFDGLSMLVNVDTTLSSRGRSLRAGDEPIWPGDTRAIFRRWGPRAPPSQGAVFLGSRLFSTDRPGGRLP